MDGMTTFASYTERSERDYVEFVRITKRAVKMIAGSSASMLGSHGSLQGSRASHKRNISVNFDVVGSRGALQQSRLDLRAQKPAHDALCYRPTVQGKRREVKINEIISNAVNLLASEGYANFTSARVARELGILPSALQNYFPTHDDLLRSTIGALGKGYLDRHTEMGKPSGKPALERLREIVEDVFWEARNPAVCRLWFEMFALAQHSDITRDLTRSVYATYGAICADLIREIDPTASARECLARATLIAAQVDGTGLLMFGAHREPVRIDRIFEVLITMTMRVAQGFCRNK
jgi:AcrR family transcriptional regulator